MKLLAKSIEKSYKGRKVVKGISLEVAQGRNCWFTWSKWSRKNNFFLYDCWSN